MTIRIFDDGICHVGMGLVSYGFKSIVIGDESGSVGNCGVARNRPQVQDEDGGRKVLGPTQVERPETRKRLSRSSRGSIPTILGTRAGEGILINDEIKRNTW